jgi:thioredoxin-like negative regulator of GroEL
MHVPSRLLAVAASAAVLFAGGTARGDGAPAGAAPAGARGAGVAFEAGPPPFSTVLAKAKAERKVVFVDFTTEWCGWCKKLEQDTFSRPEVAAAMAGFLAVHIDAEKGEGPTLAARYGAHGFPTMVVVDDAGEEVDRIVGYLPPDKFVPEIRRIEKGERTLKALKKAVAADPKDLAAALDLAEKLLDYDADGAEKLLRAVPADAHPADAASVVRKSLLLGQALQENGKRAEAVAAYLGAVSGSAGTPLFREVVGRGADLAVRTNLDAAQDFFAKAAAAAKGDADRAWVESLTFPLHVALAARALERQGELAGDDPNVLNGLAWQTFQYRHDRSFARLLPKAIEWARKAVKLSGEEPDVLDTLANLLASTGEIDEAISVEEKAAAKATDPTLRAEAQRNVAAWKAARDASKKPTAPSPAPAPVPPAPQPR